MSRNVRAKRTREELVQRVAGEVKAQLAEERRSKAQRIAAARKPGLILSIERNTRNTFGACHPLGA